MIVCPTCSTEHATESKDSYQFKCIHCGYRPLVDSGVLSWAPEAAPSDEHFPASGFQHLFDLEANSFWFRSRNALILWAIKKYCKGSNSLLEIGCGTAYVLSAVAREFPSISVMGSELASTGLKYASLRLPKESFVQLDARKLPYKEAFDVISAFDVIEHIKEDELVLKNIYYGLKPRGYCLVTVPQHMALWSPVDEHACHQRRYSAKELHRKLFDAGFEIVRSTSFVSLLLPMMFASRLFSTANKEPAQAAGLGLSARLDKLLEVIMKIEFALIRMGVPLPVGGSRLVVARKKN